MPIAGKRTDSSELQRGVRRVGNVAMPNIGGQLRQIGGELQGAGEQLLDIEHRAEANDYAFNNAVEDQIDLDRFVEESKARGFQGHHERVQEHTKKLRDRRFKEAPTRMAQEAYDGRMDRTIQLQVAQAADYERSTKIATYKANFLNRAEQLAKTMAVSPDDFKAQDMINQLHAEVDSRTGIVDGATGEFTPEEAVPVKRMLSEMIAENTLKGYIMNGRAETAYNLLTGEVLKAPGRSLPTPEETQVDLPPEEARTLGLVDDEQAIQLASARMTYKAESGALDPDQRKKIGFGERKIAQGLSPGKAESLLRQSLGAMKTARRETLGDLANQVKEARSVAIAGGQVDNALKNINSTVMQDPLMPEIAKARVLVSSAITQRIGEFASSLAQTPSSELGDFIAATEVSREQLQESVREALPGLVVNEQTFGQSEIDAFASQRQRALTEDQRMRRDDPAGYILRHQSDVAEQLSNAQNKEEREAALDRMVSRQRAFLGRIEPVIVPKQQAGELENMLNQMKSNPQGFAGVISQIEESYGKYSPQALRELGNRKGGLSGLVALSYATDPDSRRHMIENMTNGPEAVKRMLATGEHSKRDVTEAVTDQMSTFARAIRARDGSGANDATINGIRQHMEVSTSRFLNEGHRMKHAVRMAKEKVIDANFHVTESDFFGAMDSNVLVPRMLRDGVPMPIKPIEAFMRSHHREKGLRALGVDFGEHTSRIVREGEWVNNEDLTGIVFVVPGEPLGIQGMVRLDETERTWEQLSEGPFDRLTTDEMGATLREHSSRMLPPVHDIRRSARGEQ